jgi:hypothetical protein
VASLLVERRSAARSTVGNRRSVLLQASSLAFAACFGGGVFLGLPLHGRPAIPGALVLWIAAGALLILRALLALAGGAPLSGAVRRRRDNLYGLLAGAGLLGPGLVAVTGDRRLYTLSAPVLASLTLWLVRELLRGPRRSPFYARIRARRGAARMWTTYLGMPLVIILLVVLLLGSLGAIRLAG